MRTPQLVAGFVVIAVLSQYREVYLVSGVLAAFTAIGFTVSGLFDRVLVPALAYILGAPAAPYDAPMRAVLVLCLTRSFALVVCCAAPLVWLYADWLDAREPRYDRTHELVIAWGAVVLLHNLGTYACAGKTDISAPTLFAGFLGFIFMDASVFSAFAAITATGDVLRAPDFILYAVHQLFPEPADTDGWRGFIRAAARLDKYFEAVLLLEYALCALLLQYTIFADELDFFVLAYCFYLVQAFRQPSILIWPKQPPPSRRDVHGYLVDGLIPLLRNE